MRAMTQLTQGGLSEHFGENVIQREKPRLIGGEGGILAIECVPLYGLAWHCSDTGNKALI